MLNQVKSSAAIADILRADICLNRDIADGMLHEVALAERFGVSRTPIRQALQRLAYERVISVKSGVGSVVTPLDASMRVHDIRAAVAIIEAVAKCAPSHPVPASHFMSVVGILGMMDISQLNRTEDFFEIRARFLTALAEMIENPILSDAFRAAYWRLIRWSLQDLGAASEPQVAHLRELLQTAARTMRAGTLAEGFAQIAKVESRLAAAS
ncbi:GntR family transcriptional regulator [Sulfitobacter sp. W027]|mgnify:FL=1|jgi:DNA-binding GntR family transcriptional regulator|uniref:GntR family transcriptional regulator n=1 Tax=Sulfitobacter sp. W027 TaxID=2867025 RepID=UPI0021A9613C|nr:GntR family transcriptional regulator [Sulfitobacter sp. W027]UWR32449.1 GntR family transcriptional regulator [Sulfitobacter sp. W027]